MAVQTTHRYSARAFVLAGIGLIVLSLTVLGLPTIQKYFADAQADKEAAYIIASYRLASQQTLLQAAQERLAEVALQHGRAYALFVQNPSRENAIAKEDAYIRREAVISNYDTSCWNYQRAFERAAFYHPMNATALYYCYTEKERIFMVAGDIY